MKKKTLVNLLVFVLFLVSSALVSAAPRKVVVGIGNAFKPYCYLDDKGNIAGYEYEILKEVDKLLPQYEFEYQPQEFKTILLGLAAGKVDLGAHQFEVNPDRQAKFLFATESYTNFILRITTLKKRTDIKGIADLHGKKVQVGQGSNDAWTLEQYNKKNNNAINLVYTTGSKDALTIKNLEEGRVDAFVSIKRIVDSLNKQFGNKLKTVGEPIAKSNTYYVYRKDDSQLQKDVDGALKTLKKNGTLAKLSIKILGGDYTANE